MGNRNNEQRMQIKNMYKTMFGKVFCLKLKLVFNKKKYLNNRI